MKKRLIAAILATTAAGGIAVAAQIPHGPMKSDTNRDGIVSRSEFFAEQDARFKKRDANSDRKLSGAELTTGRGNDLLRADTNHDGAISFTEAAAAASARFARLDTNKDKALSPEELGPRGHRHGAGFGPGPDGPGGRMGGMMLQRADTNKDGRISRDEMRAQADERFDRLDTNKDGFLDQAELQAQRGPGPRGPGGPGAVPPPPHDGGDD